jgi:hypothetical protein
MLTSGISGKTVEVKSRPDVALPLLPLSSPHLPRAGALVHACGPTTTMNFARHSISATTPVVIFDARFDADCELFTATTPAGFAVYRVHPLTLIRKRGMLSSASRPSLGEFECPT